MTSPVVTLGRDEPAHRAFSLMAAREISAVAITDENGFIIYVSLFPVHNCAEITAFAPLLYRPLPFGSTDLSLPGA